MKGYLRDFGHPFRTLTVIVPLIALATISGTFGATAQPAPRITSFVDYYDHGFHFIFFVGSETGQPLPGVSLSILILPTNFTSPSRGPIASYHVTTDLDGLARIVATIPSANYTVQWYANSTSGSVSQSGLATPGPTDTVQGYGGDSFQPAKIGFLSTQGGLFAFLAGQDGSPPTGYSVQYAVFNFSNFLPPALNTSRLNWKTLGSMDDYHDVFSLSFSSSQTANQSLSVTFRALAPNGSVAFSSSPPNGISGTPLATFPESAGPTAQATSVVTFLTVVVSTYVGFVSVFFAFSRYGRDRVSKVLESVLWRPVTQTGLLLERYASALTAMALMTGVSILVLDLGLDAVWKVALPTEFIAVVFGSMVAMAAGLIGLVFLASRGIRSVGPLIWMNVGLLVVFYVLWTPVLSPFSNSGTGPGSLITNAALANPGLLPVLAINALTNGSFAAGAVAAVIVGASWTSVIAAGTLWAVTPIFVAAILARYRD